MIQLDGRKAEEFHLNGHSINEIYNGNTLVWRKINPPPIVIPEPVDLGLPSGTLWYPLNLGSNSDSDRGTLYSFNEVTETVEYPDPSGGNNPVTRFEFIDPASDIFHEGRKTPTQAQWEELLGCNKEIVTIGNYRNYKITGPNNNYITVPFGDYLTSTTVENGLIKGLVIFEIYDTYGTVIPYQDNTNGNDKLYRCRPIKQI